MGPKEVALVSETGGPPICICLFAALGPIPEGRHLYLCNIGTSTSATASSGALFGKMAQSPLAVRNKAQKIIISGSNKIK
jgi:hypothetical protein